MFKMGNSTVKLEEVFNRLARTASQIRQWLYARRPSGICVSLIPSTFKTSSTIVSNNAQFF